MISSLRNIKVLVQCSRPIVPFISKRSFTVTSSKLIKEIRETKEGKVLTLEGVTISSPREQYMIKPVESQQACPMCSSGLEVKHTDVLILSQFVRSDGCMLPRRITGLCRKQQRRTSAMVSMAQKAGLMPNLAPANSKRDPKQRYQWKKFNTYFDESTIRVK